MRLPSSSSLLLASLAVSSSSSSSSLSALAAPTGDGTESLSSSAPVPQPPAPPVPPHFPIPHGSDETMVRPDGYLQARSLVDKVTAPLPVPPEVLKAIPDLVHAIIDPIIGPSAPKARAEPLDVVKQLVPGKTLRAEGADEAGVNDASEDSASIAPAAESQDVPVVAANPPAGCSNQPSPRSGPVRRQEPGASEGESGSPLDPIDSFPPPAPIGSGGDVGGSSPGANVGVSSGGDGVSAGADVACSG